MYRCEKYKPLINNKELELLTFFYSFIPINHGRSAELRFWFLRERCKILFLAIFTDAMSLINN